MNKTTGATLLIAGTCIGAGMLALPVIMAPAGFLPSVLLLAICWLAMYLTGLYVLEVNLWLKEESNFISMTRATLGYKGEVVAWITYILLLYSLMAAYLSGGGGIVRQYFEMETSLDVPDWWGPVSWALIVGCIVYFGAKRVDGLNRLLLIGLVISYFFITFMAVPHIEIEYLTAQQPSFLLAALPVAITAFGYQVIVPSLRTYLHGDTKKLTKVILIGSLLPLVVYILWQIVVFGTIPVSGDNGLLNILQSGQPATELTQSLAHIVNNQWITMVSRYFVVFAIASSFLGISMSLFDFLADGLKIPKTALGKVLIALITFVPPVFYAWFFPGGFIFALGYAGVFVAILHGILPALMALKGRAKYVNAYRAPGGKFVLLLIVLFSLVIIFSQFAVNLNWISSY